MSQRSPHRREPGANEPAADALWQRRPEVAAVRRRSVATLASGQMLASLAIGVGPSVGVLLAAEVTHSEAWAGIARASMTIGAAAVALPLAAFAAARGRRTALTLAFSIATLGAIGVALSAQALIAPWAASLSAPLFIVGMLAMGFGSAASFQARFAGADLAEPAHRGRTLALVVWAGTVGAVFGPSLAQPGKLLADRFGWHPFAGAFAIAALLACLTTLLIASFLRPTRSASPSSTKPQCRRASSQRPPASPQRSPASPQRPRAKLQRPPANLRNRRPRTR